MSNLFGRIREFINFHEKQNQKKVEGPFLIALSGGSDSVFLLEALERIFPGHKLQVAHFNHRLRGRESDEDECFVRNLSRKKNLEFHLARGIRNVGLKSENESRMERYLWMERIADAEKSILCTGHNLDDQLETLLMRMHRGAGAHGLAGISPLKSRGSLKIFRPLLCLEKKEITTWMRHEGGIWREDRTNSQDIYFRNRVRLSLTPALTERSRKNLMNLHISCLFLKGKFRLPVMGERGHGLELQVEAYKSLTPFEKRYLIEKVYSNSGKPGGIDRKHMLRIDAFLEKGHQGPLQMPKGINLFCSRDLIYFEYNSSLPENAVLIPDRITSFDDWEILLELVREPLSPEILRQSGKSYHSFYFSVSNSESLIVKPSGSGRVEFDQTTLKKKMENFKIPFWRKRRLPAVYSGDELVCVPYAGSASIFFIKKASKIRFRITFRETKC